MEKLRVCIPWIAYLIIFPLVGCRDSVIPVEQEISSVSLPCSAELVRYPTTPIDFNRVYRGRAFLSDGNHLGRDLDLPEATPIYPIACGIVREYRRATGYGTLVVVIEHELPAGKTIQNGAGHPVNVYRFLSIYGHMRPTPDVDGKMEALALKPGDRVDLERPIGYIERGDRNGDGAEHLHFGIRLQTYDAAQKSDVNWFRGYDTVPTQRGYFTDPFYFMESVVRNQLPVFWHPRGTILIRRHHPDQRYLVTSDTEVRSIAPTVAYVERLLTSGVVVTDGELDCYTRGPPYAPTAEGERALRFEDVSTVYAVEDGPVKKRYAFISYEAFLSWGWRDDDVTIHPANERDAFLAAYEDAGYRLLRDGTVMKGRGQSEIAIVTRGERRPFLDWQTFVGMGYDPVSPIELDPISLDAIAGPCGEVISSRALARCGGREDALLPDAGTVPPDLGVSLDMRRLGPKDLATPDAFLVDPLDSSVAPPSDMAAPPSDMAAPPRDFARPPDQSLVEQCDGVDNNGNGLIDETFVCRLGMITSCFTACGSTGWCRCDWPPCSWGACVAPQEQCANGLDDDCDGRADCADAECAADPACIKQPEPHLYRYEFRVSANSPWNATDPFELRDQWWTPIICQNSGSSLMISIGDGWRRCDVRSGLSPFVGSFFSRAHPEWGDHGKLGTIGNAPQRCTATEGVEWRIQDMTDGRTIFIGSAAGLPCVSVGEQDRHGLP